MATRISTDDITNLARHWARQEHGSKVLLSIRLEFNDDRETTLLVPDVALPEASAPVPALAASQAGDPIALVCFSPLEKQILLAVHAGKDSAKAIAIATQQTDGNGQANHEVRYVIGNLVKRGILEDGDGYRLTANGEAVGRLLKIIN